MVQFRTHDLRKKPAQPKEKVEEKEKTQVPEEIILKPAPAPIIPTTPVEEPVVREPVAEISTAIETSPAASAAQEPRRRRPAPRKTPQRKPSTPSDADKASPKTDSRRPSRTRRPVRKVEEQKREPVEPRRDEIELRPPTPMKRSGPVIGIPCSFEHKPSDPNHTQRYFYLNQPYVTAIHEAGGIPIILPVGLEARYPNKAISFCDGILFPGGGDLDPNIYADYPLDKLGRVDPRKDRTEMDLFTLAFNMNMPILGICRGLQLINVAMDGTLHQDLQSQVRMSMNHAPNYPRSEVSHRVDIEAGTKLYKIFGETSMWVNSSHHQAVKLHGKGLIVNAKSPDGVVEGLEHPGKKWVIGVQWHPELYWRNDRLMAKLFKEFVDACG
jgi:putative glutamine amidotransferase